MTYTTYSAWGLQISSEIDLPLARSSPAKQSAAQNHPACEQPADVIIRSGDVPTSLLNPITSTPVIQVTNSEFLFCLPGAGRFLVREGREVSVQIESGAGKGVLGLHLARSGLAAVLHQLGRQPLHASGVVVDGGCVGFLGRSGAGKSTLAAALNQRGYGTLCDDICAVSFAEGSATVRQGPCWLQLWDDAARALGLDFAGARQAHPVGLRYDFPANLSPIDRPIPLRRLYILQESKLQPDGIIRLSGVEAFQRLFGHTYFAPHLAAFVQGPAGFAAYAGIARTVPVFAWTRRRGLDRHANTVDSLEQHLISQPI